MKPSDATAQQGKAEAEKKRKEQQEAKEKQGKYDHAIQEGQRSQSSGQYEQAIASYEQAQKIDPTNTRNPELDSKIAACKQEIAKAKPAQEKLDAEFARLVQEGDSAINKSDRDTAVDNYVAALKIKEDGTVRARLQYARDQ
ncbi:MAG: hypothetical protein DA330_09235 [Nitrososphaera sp.]|nr:hypothetical protein [Nitrososphaera sp.]